MSTKFIESTALPLFCAFVAGFCTCLLALENERRQVAEAAQPQGKPVALKDINAAIAPINITQQGMDWFGFRPVEVKVRAVLYPAGTIAELCTSIERHMRAVRNPESTCCIPPGGATGRTL